MLCCKSSKYEVKVLWPDLYKTMLLSLENIDVHVKFLPLQYFHYICGNREFEHMKCNVGFHNQQIENNVEACLLL